MTSAARRNGLEWRAQNRPDRVKVRLSPADMGGDTSPGCRKLQEGIVVTTVLICDDRRSVREGLTRVMSAVPGVHRIDCVAHGDELLARFSRHRGHHAGETFADAATIIADEYRRHDDSFLQLPAAG